MHDASSRVILYLLTVLMRQKMLSRGASRSSPNDFERTMTNTRKRVSRLYNHAALWLIRFSKYTL